MKFPQRWTGPQLDEHGNPLYYQKHEFRVTGVLGTRFLVAGVARSPWDEKPQRYTTNKYEVDLSDRNAPVVPATEAMWQDSAIVPQTKKDIPRPYNERYSTQPVQINGHRLSWTGERWDDIRVSPDRAWVVLQSWTGRDAEGTSEGWDIDLSWGLLAGFKGKLFWDVFNADTGQKLFTIKGKYNRSAGDIIQESAWLTERYFIVPIGEHRDRCLVCEFGRKAGTK